MTEFFTNIENIKILFVLATGLYGLTFLANRNKGIKKSTTLKQNHTYVKQIMNKIKQDNLSSVEVYEMLKESTQFRQQQSKSEVFEKGKTQSSSVQNKRKQTSKAGVLHQKEIDQMMSRHLLELIKKNNSQQQFYQYQLQQGSEEYPKLDINNFDPVKNIKKVKSCRENVDKFQDAIAYVQLPKRNQDIQIFPPYVEETQILQQNFTLECLQNKLSLRTNQQVLKQSGIMDKNIDQVNTNLMQNKFLNDKTIKKTKRLKKQSKSDSHSKSVAISGRNRVKKWNNEKIVQKRCEKDDCPCSQKPQKKMKKESKIIIDAQLLKKILTDGIINHLNFSISDKCCPHPKKK